jgi:PAS domain S-box-containing protein
MSGEFVLGDDFARVLTETTQALVCVLDSGGRILLFNDACERTTGFVRDEVLGRDAREFVIPMEESEAFADVLAYIWRTGLSSPQVGHWLTKDGGRRLIAWSNRLMPTVDGSGSYLVTTGIDLTESSEQSEGALSGDVEAKLAEVGRLAQEQRALRRVATLVASEATAERVFAAVSEETARVLDVNSSAVFRYEGDDTATVVGRLDRDRVGVFPVGDRIFADDNTAIGRARDTGLPARIQNYFELDTDVAKTMREVGYRSTVAAPIFVSGIPWGAIAIAAPETLPADSEARLMGFCELVSLAVASAQAAARLTCAHTPPCAFEARIGPRLARADPRRRRAGARSRPRGAARARTRSPSGGADRAGSRACGSSTRRAAAGRRRGRPPRRTAAGLRRGGGVLHLLGGPDKRREARPRDACAGDIPLRAGCAPLRDHRRRPGRRGRTRLRDPRATRPRGIRRRHAVRDQPARQGDGRDGDAAA